MATSTQAKPLSKRETSNLIGTDKVEETPVYRSNGNRVGQIERIMIKVAYAVMSFGGFLGMSEDYYPLPWSALTPTAAPPSVTSPMRLIESRHCIGRAGYGRAHWGGSGSALP
jgi:hypothetical protein